MPYPETFILFSKILTLLVSIEIPIPVTFVKLLLIMLDPEPA